MYDPDAVDRRELRKQRLARRIGIKRLIRGQLMQGLTQVAIGLGQVAGAGGTHLLYGQSGKTGQDVLEATLWAIAKRTARKSGLNLLGPHGSGDAVDAGWSAYEGDYVDAGLGAVQAGLAFAGADPFAPGFGGWTASLGAMAAVYSGMTEYLTYDIYTWGFGVDSEDLGRLFDN